MNTYFRIIKKASERIKKYYPDKEENAIKILVMELSGFDGANFIIHMNDEVPTDKYKIINDAVNEYLEKGRPIQHILGYSYFYGYKIKVNPDVLIPRPETEELVAEVLQTYDEVFPNQKVDVVDIGTGSGAIAISLSKEEANFTVKASDLSCEAVEVAKENAKSLDANVEFFVGDMLNPFIERNLKFDILVSNPPYICDEEYVEDIVKDNEPHMALFGGKDGLYFYDVILSNASKILNEKNIIAFEHSYSKGKEMLELAHKYFPNGDAKIYKDLNGKDRIMIIINK